MSFEPSRLFAFEADDVLGIAFAAERPFRDRGEAELINPHSYLAFYMAGPDGAEADWSLETVTPIALRRAGLPARDAFKVGETYNFTMSPARDGSHVGFLHSITLLDGRTIAVTAPANLEAGK